MNIHCSTLILDLVFIFLPSDLDFRGNEQSVKGNIMYTPQNLHLAIPAAKQKIPFMGVHMTSNKFLSTE
jgi:hypothetical protein